MHFHVKAGPGAGVAPIVAVLLSLAAPGAASAQAVPDSVRAEIEALRARVDSLAALVRRLEAAGQPQQAEEAVNELEALRAAAAAAAAAGAAADTAAGPDAGTPFEGRQRSLQALNPEISVSGDFFGHAATDGADEDNFYVREVEVAFQSALDPYSRAKVFAGFHGSGPELAPFGEHGHAEEEGEEEGGHGGEVAVEEAYVEWVGLPAGLSLKLGRFYQRFGQLNRWHAHALAFQSRSLPHLAFIGEEPLGQAGASVSTLLPFLPGGAYEATLEVTRSSNELLFGESSKPSVLGHLNAFWQLGRSADLDLGVSWIDGSYRAEDAAFDRDLQGVEAAFTWRPPQRARYRGLVVRGGVMRLEGLLPHEEDGEEPGAGEEEDHLEPGEGDALGVWSLAELRLSPRFYVGARFDWTENPEDPDETAWMVSPTLTWWQSEWVRLRLEYDLLGRSALEDDEGRLWLWVSFAMGPHKHETY